MKVCKSCRKEKPESEFYHRRGICKECKRELSRKYYEHKMEPNTVKVYTNGVMRMSRGRGRKIYWSGNMISTMKLYFPTTTNEEMVELLDHQVSKTTMLRKAKEMHLEKDPEWFKRVCREHQVMALVASKKSDKHKGPQKGVKFKGNQYVDAEGNPKPRNTKRNYGND